MGAKIVDWQKISMQRLVGVYNKFSMQRRGFSALLCITLFAGFLFNKTLNFDIMQAQVDIEFEQLVKLAKQLPETQWIKLKEKLKKK
jgi:hypothetical protein